MLINFRTISTSRDNRRRMVVGKINGQQVTQHHVFENGAWQYKPRN